MSSDATSHDEAIGQFCGVTGADEERAKGLLEACDWNLELAINMHVDTDDSRSNNRPSTSAAGPSTSSAAPVSYSDSFSEGKGPALMDEDVINIDDTPTRPASSTRPNASSRHSDSDHVRPPDLPVRQVLVPNSGFEPSDLVTRRMDRLTRTGAMSQVYDAFRDFQAEAQWQEMAQEGETSDASVQSNSQKSRTLQELFRPPLDLIFRGSLASAREAGSLKNRWLLVNIQDGREFLCQTLNRDVWSNQTVKDILKEHFIFWQVDRNTVEGSKYIQFYKVKSFPHISIIDPRTGELMKSWPTTIDHNSFCDSVIEFLTEHPSVDGSCDSNSMKKLCVKDDDVTRTLYDQSEEAQLEAAIKASLKDSENSNSSRAFHDEDSFPDTIESETDQTTQSSFSGRMMASSSSSSASARKEKYEDKTTDGDVTMKKKKEIEEVGIDDYHKYLGSDTQKFSDLIVRFPDGSREQLKLPSDSLLKALFLLLKSKGYGTDQYNYLTNFPRRLLHELPCTDTLQDAKLTRETIFLEKRVKED